MPSAPAKPCPVPACPERIPCPQHSAERARVHERDRTQAEPWRKWYHLARWRHPVYGLRTRALARDPICRECRADGRVVASTEVDHVTPHHGDPRLFWNLENLQGLCTTCHNRKTASGE